MAAGYLSHLGQVQFLATEALRFVRLEAVLERGENGLREA